MQKVINRWRWRHTCCRGFFQIKMIFLAKDIRKIIQFLAKLNSLHIRVGQNKHFHTLCQLKFCEELNLPHSILRWSFLIHISTQNPLPTKVSSNIECIFNKVATSQQLKRRNMSTHNETVKPGAKMQAQGNWTIFQPCLQGWVVN